MCCSGWTLGQENTPNEKPETRKREPDPSKGSTASHWTLHRQKEAQAPAHCAQSEPEKVTSHPLQAAPICMCLARIPEAPFEFDAPTTRNRPWQTFLPDRDGTRAHSRPHSSEHLHRSSWFSCRGPPRGRRPLGRRDHEEDMEGIESHAALLLHLVEEECINVPICR